MKALVAGGAGFIGSHLCDRLLARGDEVLCVDNLLTGAARNIAHLQGKPGFTFLRHDVTQPLDAEADLVFHLASPASPGPNSARSYLKLPLETALVNSQGTLQLLELARRNGARFLMASTSEIYGDPDPRVHPQPETYWGNVNTVGPRSCYDESKRFAEALVTVYRSQYGLDGRVVRIFNTYGPRLDPEDGRVVSNFIAQALRGEPLTVYGDGSQTRSLCYIDDLVHGILLVMDKPRDGEWVFNLGNPDERSVLDWAKLIRELCGSKSDFTFKPLPKDDPRQRCPDITRAKTILGWQPKVSAREGLERTVAWYREALFAPASEQGPR